MKLVIDIPEEVYKDIQSHDWKNGERWYSEEWKAIHNGTPLDNIRAEIAEEQNDCVVKEQYDTAYGLELALWIIDKYKGESEDKCKNCKYYRNPDYTRCHECEAEREDKE